MTIVQVLGRRAPDRVTRDFAAYLPTQAIPGIAGLLALPILARELSPTKLGILAIAQTLITLGWVGGGGWLASAVLRELPAYQSAGRLHVFGRPLARGLAVTGAGLVAFAGLLALAGIRSDAIGDNLAWIVAAAAGLIVQNVAHTLFSASLRRRAYAIFSLVGRTGGIALGVALVFAGYGVRGYLLGLAAFSLGIGALGIAWGWPRGTEFVASRADASVAAWLRYGVPASAAGIATWALSFVDRYILAALKNTGAVGVYSVGNVIGDKPILIPTMAFMTAASPLVIAAFHEHGRAEVERLMTTYTRLVLLGGLPLVALVGASAGAFVSLVAGNDYAAAARVAPIVSVGSLVYALSLVGYTGLVVARRTIPMAYAALLAMGVNVVANLILIPPFGVTGAAIATPIGTTAFLVLCQVWSRRYATWRFPFRTLLGAGAAAAVAWVAARGATVLVSGDGAQLLVALGVGAAVYCLLVVALGELRPAERPTWS